MAEEINFLELACLLKVTQNTVLERFGSAINASIFDASNIAGSLKQHGLIDFTAYYPGPNEIMVTEEGKKLIAEAEAKSAEPYDKLDEAVLEHLSGGKRIPAELQNTLNLRPRDLALRLYKLNKQGFLIYELKSGRVDLMLTESGFLKVGGTHPVQKPRTTTPEAGQPEQAPRQQTAAQQETRQMAEGQPASPTGPAAEPQLHGKPFMKSAGRPLIAAIVVIIIIVLILHFYLHAI